MVYLNNDVNRRGSASGNNYGGGIDYGEVTFEGDILAVGFDWQHTLWFSDTDYGTDDYPKWSFANQVGNQENLKIENLSLMFTASTVYMGHGFQIGITQSFLVVAIMEIKIGLGY